MNFLNFIFHAAKQLRFFSYPENFLLREYNVDIHRDTIHVKGREIQEIRLHFISILTKSRISGMETYAFSMTSRMYDVTSVVERGSQFRRRARSLVTTLFRIAFWTAVSMRCSSS